MVIIAAPLLLDFAVYLLTLAGKITTTHFDNSSMHFFVAIASRCFDDAVTFARSLFYLQVKAERCSLYFVA